MVRKLILFLGLLAAGASAFAASRLERNLAPASAAASFHVESAPLALASRAFAQIELSLDDAFETEQLAHKLKDTRGSEEEFVARQTGLIAGLRGVNGVQVEALTQISQLTAALAPIASAVALSHDAAVDDVISAESLHRFEVALAAALRAGSGEIGESAGLHIFASRVRAVGDSRILTLIDEETGEALLLALTTPAP